jgi:uncharacterized Zn finger protein (UPF0148 family)
MSSSAPLSAVTDDRGQDQHEVDIEVHDVSGRVLRRITAVGKRGILLGIARLVELKDGRVYCPVCDQLYSSIDSVARHLVVTQCRGFDDAFESESDEANSMLRVGRFVAATQAITEAVAAEESKFADLERRTDELRRMVSIAVARQQQGHHFRFDD